jgi:hypothetical protein
MQGWGYRHGRCRTVSRASQVGVRAHPHYHSRYNGCVSSRYVLITYYAIHESQVRGYKFPREREIDELGPTMEEGRSHVDTSLAIIEWVHCHGYISPINRCQFNHLGLCAKTGPLPRHQMDIPYLLPLHHSPIDFQCLLELLCHDNWVQKQVREQEVDINSMVTEDYDSVISYFWFFPLFLFNALKLSNPLSRDKNITWVIVITLRR